MRQIVTVLNDYLLQKIKCAIVYVVKASAKDGIIGSI